MEFPQFWKIVEERSNIAPNDILNLKQILSILGFKTMESISKLSSKSEMDKVELEFFKLKETNRFDEKYPNLQEEKFGVGMKAIINSIANQIKRGLFMVNVNVNFILNSVHDECKTVSFDKLFVFNSMSLCLKFRMDKFFIDLSCNC